MKRILLALLSVLPLSVLAQLNVQFNYDLGKVLYGNELSDRPPVTITIENFTPDKWGNTYFFVDANLGNKQMKSAYAEISRELKFWKAPFAVHLEYNGGLSNQFSYNDAYLIGGAYNWANQDFSRTFSLQAMYRYLAHQKVGTKHSWQLTTVWGVHFAKGLCSFLGYTDLAYDQSVNGNLVFSSEPQFFVNLHKLKKISDDCKVSVGCEVEISNNMVWPTDGKNNRFYAIPALIAKWTF